jgi:glutamate/aspartate transport system substrate-binding protein
MMIKQPRRLLMAATLAAALLSAPALAQELTGTLKKIKETGVISLGHRESSIPFSYYDDKQQVIGYSHELMLKVVAAVKADLKLAKLDTRLMPVTSANRITLVQNGTVDIECGSTTNNTERQKQVSFSNTIFVIGTRLMTKKDSGIKDFPDLAGKNVVTTAGTTSERLLRKMNEDKQMKMNIISAKDHGEVLPDPRNRSRRRLHDGRRAALRRNGQGQAGQRLGGGRHAAVVRSLRLHAAQGRPGIQEAVDAALAKVMTSGEAEKIYAKWFLQPIPPKGLNLNFPLSDAVKTSTRRPTTRRSSKEFRSRFSRRRSLRKAPACRKTRQSPMRPWGKETYMAYNWNWKSSCSRRRPATTTYLGWMFYGLKMTITLSLSAWVIALAARCGRRRPAHRPEPLAVRVRDGLRRSLSQHSAARAALPLVFRHARTAARSWATLSSRPTRSCSSSSPRWSVWRCSPAPASPSRCARGSTRCRPGRKTPGWRWASRCRRPIARDAADGLRA